MTDSSTLSSERDMVSGEPSDAIAQLRSEIGQLTLDETFAARERLNQKLLEEANAVTAGWGVDVTRIEVRDIHPSPEIVSSMEMQMAAERKKRAAILESEGARAAQVNAAEGKREATVLGARGEQGEQGLRLDLLRALVE